MIMLSEQVKHLRELSDTAKSNVYSFEALSRSLKEAADTIETLSAKQASANMERPDMISKGRMSDAEQLLPCPFCGGKAAFETKGNGSSHYDVGFTFTIKCKGCGCRLPKQYSLSLTLGDCGQIIPQADDRNEAVKEWNRRVK